MLEQQLFSDGLDECGRPLGATETDKDRTIEAFDTELGNLGLWVGKDVAVGGGFRLEPQEIKDVEIAFPEGSLPPIDYADNLNLLLRSGLLGFSLRSRLAQCGVNALGKMRTIIEDKVSKILLTVQNLGGRPIQFCEGDALGCFFSTRGAQLLQGEVLEKLVAGGIIGISGEPGEDYKYIVENETIVGVALKISNQWWHIPDSDEPIIAAELANGGTRDGVDGQVLVDGKAPGVFSVGQTLSSLTLSEGYCAVLAPFIYGSHSTIQTGSVLIKGDGEETPGWPVRVELVDTQKNLGFPEPPNENGHYLRLRFYKNPEADTS